MSENVLAARRREREKLVLAFIEKNPGKIRREISENTGVPTSTVNDILLSLEKKGKIANRGTRNFKLWFPENYKPVEKKIERIHKPSDKTPVVKESKAPEQTHEIYARFAVQSLMDCAEKLSECAKILRPLNRDFSERMRINAENARGMARALQ